MSTIRLGPIRRCRVLRIVLEERFTNHFNNERHLTDRQTYKANRSAALAEWQNLMA